MRADDLAVIKKKGENGYYLNEYEYKHETLRALLEISNSLRNITSHLYETRESIDYLSSKIKSPDEKDIDSMIEGAI